MCSLEYQGGDDDDSIKVMLVKHKTGRGGLTGDDDGDGS